MVSIASSIEGLLLAPDPNRSGTVYGFVIASAGHQVTGFKTPEYLVVIRVLVSFSREDKDSISLLQ